VRGGGGSARPIADLGLFTERLRLPHDGINNYLQGNERPTSIPLLSLKINHQR
jgi:hypothetical protein